MKKAAWFVLTILNASPVWAREAKPACGIVPTSEVCVSEPVLVDGELQPLYGAGTDCEAWKALSALVAHLKQAGIDTTGIKVTCTYEQLGKDSRSWELTL